VQRQSATQPLRRILGPDRFGDLNDVHPVSLG
jgi:hypothetical protein